ncbi:MAG: hypothetical protein CMO98_08185 [Woeseia sp.]|nr:hypothetical protein [Woeseia sp.]|tara:strand:+ start:5032 stop:5289 length:258 start_codon:yes stop_codon:yes gene_type:complete
MKKEITLFLISVLVGITVLPIAIYLVGDLVFGEYGEGGYSGFFIDILTDLLTGTGTIWFLTLSPYIVLQILRLTRHILRVFKQSQ